MQTLTLEGIKRSARKAYRARLLTAQHPVQSKRICKYEIGKYHCAIGCALTLATLKLVESRDCNGLNLENMLESECATFDGGYDDRQLAYSIQVAHDDWADASKSKGGKHTCTVAARKYFLKHIGM